MLVSKKQSEIKTLTGIFMESILSRFFAQSSQLRLFLKILFVVLVLIGFVFALIPMHGMSEIPHMDKIMHALAFFSFAALLDLATNRHSFWRWKVPLLLGYGAAIEVLQLFTPWRSFSVADFGADALGIFLYWLLWYMVLKRFISHAVNR